MSIQKGQTYQVLRGTFQGMDARVISVAGGAIEVVVSMFGREVPATLQAIDLGRTPLERKADRLLLEDAKLGHKLRSQNYWRAADVSSEEERVEAWARFEAGRAKSEEVADEEAKRTISELAKAHADDGDALRAVEADAERWRPHRHALREALKRKEAPVDESIREEAERAHWRAVTMNVVPPAGWAEEASAAMIVRRDEDFRAEIRRTRALAQTAVRTYGLAGFRAAWTHLCGEGEVMPLSDLPAAHPWRSLALCPPREAVRALFPEGDCIAEVLASRLRAIFALRRNEHFQLLYLLDAFEVDYIDGARQVFEVPAYVVANPPTSAEDLDAYSTKHGWTLPAPLRALYKVHNGLGPGVRMDAGSIEPLDRLRVLGELMNPIVREQGDVPEDYRYDDLLGFYQDGAGNGQYFHRAQGELTCDWDHETRQLGTPVTFEAFCRECLPTVWLGQE